MFVYLKESEMHRKIFINKNFKHETVRILFDKKTPVHEIENKELAKSIVNSFPLYLNCEETAPSFLSKKEIVEEKKAEPIPAPTPVEQPIPDPIPEATPENKEPDVVTADLKVEEKELSPIEKITAAQEYLDDKEKSKRGRKKNI